MEKQGKTLQKVRIPINDRDNNRVWKKMKQIQRGGQTMFANDIQVYWNVNQTFLKHTHTHRETHGWEFHPHPWHMPKKAAVCVRKRVFRLSVCVCVSVRSETKLKEELLWAHSHRQTRFTVTFSDGNLLFQSSHSSIMYEGLTEEKGGETVWSKHTHTHTPFKNKSTSPELTVTLPPRLQLFAAARKTKQT